jgi:hypothetical protein
MTIGTILEDQRSGEQSQLIDAHVRASGPVPPEGARLAVGGPSDQGWRVITVWDSREARDRFYAERLTPAYRAAGLSFDDVALTQFQVDMLVAADLTGVVG